MELGRHSLKESLDGCAKNCANKHSSDKGAVLVELVVGIGFILLACLGGAQLFMNLNTKVRMENLRAQVQLGPMDRPMTFTSNSNSPSFAMLSSADTTKLYKKLAKVIQDKENETTVFVSLSYLTINSATGVASSPTYGTPQSFIKMNGWCKSNAVDLGMQLRSYTQDRVQKLQNVSSANQVPPQSNNNIAVPTNPTSTANPLGIRLFDVNLATTSYKAYITYLPVVTILLCNEPNAPLYTSPVIYKTVIVPRTNIN